MTPGSTNPEGTTSDSGLARLRSRIDPTTPETDVSRHDAFIEKVDGDFEVFFEGRLDEHQDRAIEVTKNFGENVYGKVMNLLLHASDQGSDKVEEVLGLMEKHYDEVLTYQHPEIRGFVEDAFHENKTDTFFYTTLVNTLGLRAAEY